MNFKEIENHLNIPFIASVKTQLRLMPLLEKPLRRFYDAPIKLILLKRNFQ